MGYLSIDTITTPSHTYHDVPGGAALYAALGALAAGAKVSVVACAGDDVPQDWLEQMAALGLDVSRIVRKPGPTRRARLINAADDSRQSAHHHEEQWWERTRSLAPDDTPDPAADYVVLAPMPAQTARAILSNATCSLIADTSAAFAATERDAVLGLLSRLDCFAPSLEETRSLLPDLSDDEALRDMAKGKACIVQKRGAQGMALCAAGSSAIVLVSPVPVSVLDPTGAGDATVGALAAGLAKGLPLLEAAAFAASIGARCVTGAGPSALGFAWQASDPHARLPS